ncbi:MAG: hypothetical protein GVY09_06925, partial [Gammaproteobacteria bacterium]|nr:hypothetical protein [Gammaproteobacteria bacterium]
MSLGHGLLEHGRLAARLVLAAAILTITWLALTPQPDPPGLGWDKLNHLAAFFVLAALAEAGWPGRAALPWRLARALTASTVSGFVPQPDLQDSHPRASPLEARHSPPSPRDQP